MKILVLNCGSSSIKYKLFDMTSKEVIAQGGIEKIGLKGSFLKLTTRTTKSPAESLHLLHTCYRIQTIPAIQRARLLLCFGSK